MWLEVLRILRHYAVYKKHSRLQIEIFTSKNIEDLNLFDYVVVPQRYIDHD